MRNLVLIIFALRVVIHATRGNNNAETNDQESLIENNTTNLLFNDVDEILPISPSKTVIWGPGIHPHEIVLSARYFYVQLVANGKNLTASSYNLVEAEDLRVRVDCNLDRQVWSQVLDRRDGSFIIRYKLFQSCLKGFRIILTYRNHHLGKSPYIFNASVHPDNCYCPKLETIDWLHQVRCPKSFKQLTNDLQPFPNGSVNFELVLQRTIEKFFHPASHSFCHYALVDNQIYRKCYGQHTGFHIFPDAILLSLARKMFLPDIEFIINLGDWPLIQKQRVRPPLPIFSWCKSNETLDILLPTYELTEASLEGMGRVSLDMMTVQTNSPVSWEYKISKLFWRGRDSRQERLDLIELGRKYPDLFNVSLTNFFFFRDKEQIYGPKVPHVSFFQFFMYKYQLNIDGTVAAYRLPFLLGGDAVIFKVDSPYIEHFYIDLIPWVHYIPVKDKLQDLVTKIEWARDNDDKAQRISVNGRKYAQEHLMPLDVLCYHATAYQEWSYRLKNPGAIHPDMEIVNQVKDTPLASCECDVKSRNRKKNVEERLEL